MQNFFTDIQELNTSGTQLANILDDASEAIRSGHYGETRPSYATEGMIWIQVDDVNDLTSGFWKLNIFDGNNDVTILQVDPVNHTVTFGGDNLISSFQAARNDGTADILELLRRVSTSNNSGGFIYRQDNDNSETVTYGKVKVRSTSVANGAEESAFVVELLQGGSLYESLVLTKNGIKAASLAGSNYRSLYTDPTGLIKARPAEYAVETDFYQGEKIIKDNQLYLVTSDFTSHATDFSQDIGNLRPVGNTEYIIKQQTMAVNAEVISIDKTGQQMIEIDSSGGDLFSAQEPFGTDPTKFINGMRILVINVGADEFKFLTDDRDYGYVGNGELTIKKGHLVEFIYNSTLKRFLAKTINF